MQKRILLLSALVLLCLGSNARESSDIRLLYWNIQNGMWSDQPNNYDNFVKFVKEQDPDICVWCEASSIYYSNTADGFKTNDEKFLPFNWDSLAARYGHNYVYLGGWRDNYPQVITSKFPIKNVKRILGDPDDVIVSHGAGWAQIEVQGQTLNLVTLHTWPHGYAYRAEDREASIADNGGHKYRAREMKYICDATINTEKKAKDQFWMMMGDFNSRSRVDAAQYDYPEDSPAYLVHDYIRSNTPYLDIIHEWYKDEFQPSTGGRSRIDYVYATPAMYNCIHFTKIFKSEGWLKVTRDPQNLSNFYHPSDHLPVLVDFSFTEARNPGKLEFEWKDLERGAQYSILETEMFGAAQTVSVFRYPASKFKTDIVNDGGLNKPMFPGRPEGAAPGGPRGPRPEGAAPGGPNRPDVPAFPTATDPDKPATTTTGFAQRYDAYAAMNGSYFNVRTLFPATYVKDEKKVEGRTYPSEMFRVDGAVGVKGKTVTIASSDTSSYDAVFKGCKDILAGGPVLMKNGEVMNQWPMTSFFFGRHPRSVIGSDADGYVYLVVIDGRFPGKAVGMTIPETAEICRQLGLMDAINLDGGGSSALWIKPSGVISHPFDNHQWDNVGERVVPNAIIVK